MKEGYYLGLDMGTGSTGWAVTNKNYELLRAHGKTLWGARLFETANTAEERRSFRTARRRLDRRNWRLQILQELFSEEISKIDMGFFQRMKESRYVPEDKRDLEGNCPELPYALFVDPEYTDKDYHKQFPTIYHLRNMLMETEETPDLRLIYLALHHMMKHRGHFLLSGSIENIKEFSNTFRAFIEIVRDEELNFNLEFNQEDIAKIEKILRDREQGKNAKKTLLIKTFAAKTPCEKALLNLIVGGTVKLSDIFDDSDLDGCERAKISFSDNNYDDYVSVVEADLAERYCIVEAAKAVYDWSVLVDILGDHASISAAKVALYEKHKKDLEYLKKIVKEHLSNEVYKTIFVKTDEKISNYCAYIGMTKINGKKREIQGKKCSREEFKDFLMKNVVSKIEEVQVAEYLKEELEKDTFLPKQVAKNNGVIPYQVHLYELNKILKNLENRIPLLKENHEKIVQLFTFRIPYYVGPMGVGKNADSQKFAWAVRKTNEKLLPWNLEEVIDVEASAEQFIRRMTNKCTYLYGEDVLPKESLLYSKFMVLNELNNLRLNGEKIDVSLKQTIYEEVFCKSRKITHKKLKDFLIRNGIVKKDVEITGIDGDFKASLNSYHDFKEKLTGIQLTDKQKEEVILNITLFGEDKKLLRRRLEKMFPELTEKQISSLSKLSYQGWGRLSRAFLEEITAPAPETGEVWNIITALWESNQNLMQLLGREYLFAQSIEAFNEGDSEKKLSYQEVEALYVSPAVKRQIWQTLKIVREIQKVMGRDPERVFIEMAREKQESKRTESRKKQLIDLYQSCKKEEHDWIGELKQQEDQHLRSDKLYLYYVQKGCCMYSGEKIKLEELWDNTKYDIDHIYPQSKTMDDSLDNRVLVKKEYNAEKSDTYPIKKSIRDKMTPFWKALLMGNFISKKKYERLTRHTEFDANELTGFIERQLVETRQGTKAVAELLKYALPNTEIVYVKAKTVSQFRQDFALIKVREMNDLHHAKDAYLNIVVGNCYFVKFTASAAKFIKENPGRTYNLKRMFTSNQNIERKGEIAWKAGGDGTIHTVKNMMRKNNVLITRKSYEVKGGLFDQQIMKKGKGQVPVKGNDERLSDINKYGGYNKATGAYFVLVESKDKKGTLMRTIEYVPLYLKEILEKDQAYFQQYLMQERGLKEPEIRLRKIKTDTLFNVDGFKMWLSGRTENRLIFKCANQLLLDPISTATLKKVSKFCMRFKENKLAQLGERDELTEEMLLALYDVFLDKIKNTVYKVRLSAQEKTLEEKRDKFVQLKREEQCLVLGEILHMFQCQSGSANLKLIGGPGSAGILVMNNNITKCKQISIINQSPTGIYEQEIDLQKV